MVLRLQVLEELLSDCKGKSANIMMEIITLKRKRKNKDISFKKYKSENTELLQS